MDKPQIELAVGTGLNVFGPESELQIPVAQNEGIFYLRMLLTGIATGQIILAPGTVAPPMDGNEPPAEIKKAAARKKTKKRAG